MKHFQTRIEAAQFCDLCSISRTLVKPSNVEGFKWCVEVPENAQPFKVASAVRGADKYGNNYSSED